MANLTTVVTKTYHDADRTVQKRWTIPSVGGSSTSEEHTIDVGVQEGLIKAVRAVATGTVPSGIDFDVSIRTKTGIDPTVNKDNDEIYVTQNVNNELRDNAIEVYFANNDSTVTKNLYVVVTNNDASATTDIDLDLVYHEM